MQNFKYFPTRNENLAPQVVDDVPALQRARLHQIVQQPVHDAPRHLAVLRLDRPRQRVAHAVLPQIFNRQAAHDALLHVVQVVVAADPQQLGGFLLVVQGDSWQVGREEALGVLAAVGQVVGCDLRNIYKKLETF